LFAAGTNPPSTIINSDPDFSVAGYPTGTNGVVATLYSIGSDGTSSVSTVAYFPFDGSCQDNGPFPDVKYTGCDSETQTITVTRYSSDD
jgi:hypothetical protein